MDNKAFEGNKNIKAEPAVVLKMADVEKSLKVESTWVSRKMVLMMSIVMLFVCCTFIGILFHIQQTNKKEIQTELRLVMSKLNDTIKIRSHGQEEQASRTTNEQKEQNVIPTTEIKMATKQSRHMVSNDLQTSLSNNVPTMKRKLIHSSRPWLNMRLPQSILPISYHIDLNIDMVNDMYKGEVTIDVAVTQNTDVIILHMVGLNIINVNINDLIGSRQIGIKNDFYYAANEYYVIQTNSFLQQDGEYSITVNFTGRMGTDLNGFYTSYYDVGGIQKKVASTFFSPISARKAFPCFDEPSLKAYFTLSLTHSNKYKAQSNMKPVSTCNKDNVLTTNFNTTLKMSTYLLCWVISEYNFIESPIDTRISAWADNVDDVRFGLQTSTKLLSFYEQYFNISYPLAKLDIVSIPSFGPGAMENWGIITFRAERILINQKTSTQYLRQKSFNIIAHELVHQWFGNLVTMKFWNDAWLKEGFANNIGAIGGHHVDKNMGSKEQVLTSFMIPALEVDAYATSHPISSNVKTPSDIRGIFDLITYNKGSCLVDLLHNYLGDEDFRKGLQSYLNTYAYRNANQDDLWNELSKVSGKNVKTVMDTWTLQLGYPLISVRRLNESFVEIKQKRFSLDTPGTRPPTSPFGYTWKVPIIFKSPSTQNTVSYLLEEKEAIINVPEHYSILNPDHSLFYRVKYDDRMMAKINTMLQNEPTLLTAQDRTGLISDQFSFVTAKMVDIKKTLNLLSYLKQETDFYPWKVALDQLTVINYFITNEATRTKFNRYIAKLTADVVKKVGWMNTTTVNEGSLQVLVLKHACQPGSIVYSEAEKHYLNWTYGKTVSLRPSLHPVFKDCAISAGPEFYWNFAYMKYRNIERDDALLWALTATTKVNKIKELLKLSLDNDVIDTQYTPYVVSNLAERNHQARVLCWEFIKENWDVIIKRYGTDVFMLSDMLSSVLNYFSTEEELNDVKEFFSNRFVGSGKNAVKQAIHKIEGNIEWKKNNFQLFNNWLNEQSV